MGSAAGLTGNMSNFCVCLCVVILQGSLCTPFQTTERIFKALITQTHSILLGVLLSYLMKIPTILSAHTW